ncbi:hypothetical protein ACI3L1_17720 [Deinococcus sp. SM5_A1]
MNGVAGLTLPGLLALSVVPKSVLAGLGTASTLAIAVNSSLRRSADLEA